MTSWCWLAWRRKGQAFLYNNYGYSKRIINERIRLIGRKSRWPSAGDILSIQSDSDPACRYISCWYNCLGRAGGKTIRSQALNAVPGIWYLILVRVLCYPNSLLRLYNWPAGHAVFCSHCFWDCSSCFINRELLKMKWSLLLGLYRKFEVEEFFHGYIQCFGKRVRGTDSSVYNTSFNFRELWIFHISLCR